MTLHPYSLHEVKGERSAFDSSSPVMCSHAGVFSVTVRGSLLPHLVLHTHILYTRIE